MIQPSAHGLDNSDQLEAAARINLPFRAVVVVGPEAPDQRLGGLTISTRRLAKLAPGRPPNASPRGWTMPSNRAVCRARKGEHAVSGAFGKDASATARLVAAEPPCGKETDAATGAGQV